MLVNNEAANTPMIDDVNNTDMINPLPKYKNFIKDRTTKADGNRIAMNGASR